MEWFVVAPKSVQAASFTSYQADLRDGLASNGVISDGGSTYSPGAWKWLNSTSINLGTATSGTTSYAATVSVGIYHNGTVDANNYLEMSLPSDFPTGTYYIFVYGRGWAGNTIGFKIDNGTPVISTNAPTSSRQWYKIGQFSITKDSKLRFTRTTDAGGNNLASVQINPTDTLPTNTPTGQEGTLKNYITDPPITLNALSPIQDSLFIGAGDAHTLMRISDGTVKAWGYNLYGQLGLGDTTNRNVATNITGLTSVNQVATGSNHSFAILNDATVKAWGYNNSGQLGLGDTTNRNAPTAISGLSDVNQIAAGGSHTLGLLYDGTVKAWGLNANGQLGLGDTTNRNTPTVVSGLSGFKQIAAGVNHTLALMNDGTVKVWGNNANGQLGLGDTTSRNTATTISNLSGVKQIAAKGDFSIALMEDGTVKAWGYNNYGQLGLGDTTDRNSPTVISGLTGVKKIAAGVSHSLAIMGDYSVKAWGYNANGRLGLGDTTNRTAPVSIPGLAGINHLAAGNHALALTVDGDINSWGYNANGQLGLGDLLDRTAPIKITSLLLPIVYVPINEGESLTLSILIYSSANSTFTCKYYIDAETTPRESIVKAVFGPSQTVTFNTLDISLLNEGNHTIKYEITDGTQTIQKLAYIYIDKAPAVGTFTITSTDTSITVTGTATDNSPGLAAAPYRYTIDSTTTAWTTGSYTQTLLLPNTKHLVTFEAKDLNGKITISTKEVHTKALVPALSINNPTTTTLQLNITDDNPASTQYQIMLGPKYVTASGTLTTQPVWTTIGSKQMIVSGLTPGVSYTFKVKARSGQGEETAFSAPASLATVTKLPPTPTNLKAVPTSNSVLVSWSATANATSYEIEIEGRPIFLLMEKLLS